MHVVYRTLLVKTLIYYSKGSTSSHYSSGLNEVAVFTRVVVMENRLEGEVG